MAQTVFVVHQQPLPFKADCLLCGGSTIVPFSTDGKGIPDYVLTMLGGPVKFCSEAHEATWKETELPTMIANLKQFHAEVGRSLKTLEAYQSKPVSKHQDPVFNPDPSQPVFNPPPVASQPYPQQKSNVTYSFSIDITPESIKATEQPAVQTMLDYMVTNLSLNPGLSLSLVLQLKSKTSFSAGSSNPIQCADNILSWASSTAKSDELKLCYNELSKLVNKISVSLETMLRKQTTSLERVIRKIRLHYQGYRELSAYEPFLPTLCPNPEQTIAKILDFAKRFDQTNCIMKLLTEYDNGMK